MRQFTTHTGRPTARRRAYKLLALALFLVGCLFGPVTQASTAPPDGSGQALGTLLLFQQAELTAADEAAGDTFGYSAALSGDTAMVGAPNHNTAGNTWAGAAYVFVRSGTTWTQQAELTAADGAANDAFGMSVAVDGDTALVGALFHNVGGSDVGAAYVFVRSGTTWTQQAELTAADGAANDSFGMSVAVDGDTALVGAGNKMAGGAAYVFVRSGTTWTQQAELTAADEAAGDTFGYSAALSGDTALVGALFHNVGGNTWAGAAYVFVRSGTTWTQQAELTAADGAANDWFGYRVAVSGDTALVGATSQDTAGKAGAAYVFVRSGTTWTHQAKLTAADQTAGNLFGDSVAIDGDSALVGAPGYYSTAAGFGVGAAYVFVRSGTTWTQQAELTAADGAANDAFGFSVAVSGDTALVSAVNRSTAGKDYDGTAYVFAPDDTTPTTTVSGVATGWSKTPVSVTLTASDGGSGVATTQYCLLDAPVWTTYAGPFEVSSEGSWTYEYRSIDVAGNVEVTKTFTARIDSTPPDTSNDVDSPAYGADVTVTLTAVDELSGVAGTSHSLDGGPWTMGTSVLVAAPLDHSNDGVHTVSYYTTDVAGNSEAVKTCALLIDTRKPTPEAPALATVRQNRTATLKFKVHESGPNAGKANVTIKIKTLRGKVVKTIKLRNKDVNELLRCKFRCQLAKRTYRFYIYARDAAGNKQSRVVHNKLVVK